MNQEDYKAIAKIIEEFRNCNKGCRTCEFYKRCSSSTIWDDKND